MYLILKKRVVYLILCVSFLFVLGCFPKGRVSYIEQFVIDYSPPKFENISPLITSIKIERFSIVEVYNNTRMNYKTSPYKIDNYTNGRWRINPSELLSDYFIRDLAHANMFVKVFSYKEPSDGVFSLEAGIEDFVEIIEDNKSYSVLTVNIVLLDNRETDITKKIVFQKKYSEKELITEHNPESFAKGMSIAFKRISVKIINDIYNSLKQHDMITLN